MIDDDATAVATDGPGVRSKNGMTFQGMVTLGQIILLVPLLGLLGTATVTLFRTGAWVQQLEDAIAKESEARAMAQGNLEHRVDTVALQQSHDINILNARLAEMGQDIRLLVSASIDPKKR